MSLRRQNQRSIFLHSLDKRAPDYRLLFPNVNNTTAAIVKNVPTA